MEGEENHNIPSPPLSGGESPSSHRWNPTKEQISMLENIYKQGIKTPTAEQIQEITSRLKEYGHIEGKNVFYWFQNHKARQRQKQKQDHLASFNRFLHHTPPPPPPYLPPPPNVVCSPYYLPPSDLGFYPHCPKLLLPPLVKRRNQMPENIQKPSHNFAGELSGFGECMLQMDTTPANNHETLALFPMHPTGILQEKAISASNSSEATTPSSSSDTTTYLNEQEAAAAEHHFFDFSVEMEHLLVRATERRK